MITVFRLKEFFRYKIQAKSEFKIHSPFAYDFYTKVIRSKQKFPEELIVVEKIRKNACRSSAYIVVSDFGTGKLTKPAERKISDIIRHYTNSKKDAYLLYRIVQYVKPYQILELGTSLGISAMYMSLADTHIPVTTIEACPQTAAAARSHFEKLSLDIDIVIGNFDEVLMPTLNKTKGAGLIFFDGNHTKEATLRYFFECLKFADERSVFVFDDIYWSPGMKEAWNEIWNHPEVRTSIDLHRLGIVFFDKKIAKQHFVLKY